MAEQPPAKSLKEIEDLAAGPKADIIKKTVDVTFDSKNYRIRIPKEIVNFMGIQKGDKFKFKVVIKKPKEASVLSCSYIKVLNNNPNRG